MLSFDWLKKVSTVENLTARHVHDIIKKIEKLKTFFWEFQVLSLHFSMVKACSAFGCSFRDTVGNRKAGISFHEFPKDPILRIAWALATRREGLSKGSPWIPPPYAYLCSRHFTANDFEVNDNIRKLRKGSVPSIFSFSEPRKKILKPAPSHVDKPDPISSEHAYCSKDDELTTFNDHTRTMFSKNCHLADHRLTIDTDKDDELPALNDHNRTMFSKESHLTDRHRTVSAVKKRFVCGICDKSYKALCSVKAHMLSHANEKTFTCEVCSKDFSSKRNLMIHLKIHNGEKDIKCDVCSKEFLVPYELTRHLPIHTKSFSCDQCDKTFTLESYLVAHKRRHTGEKPYACDLCDKKFNLMQTLNRHRRKHTGEKLFQCELSDKTLGDFSNLERHNRIHTGEKPYACEFCNKKFNQKGNFKTHLQKYHA